MTSLPVHMERGRHFRFTGIPRESATFSRRLSGNSQRPRNLPMGFRKFSSDFPTGNWGEV